MCFKKLIKKAIKINSCWLYDVYDTSQHFVVWLWLQNEKLPRNTRCYGDITNKPQ